MQKISFNYKDDDSTFNFNERMIGLIDSGVYRGFLPARFSALVLEMSHTDGAITVNKNLGQIANVGVIVTKQGAIVREDSTINVNVQGNANTTMSRIDLVVLEHQFVEAVNGIPAVYVVVQGTPSATPVAPDVLSNPMQVPICTIEWPPSTFDLANTTMKRVFVKDFAGDSTIVHINRTNEFKDVQFMEEGLKLGDGTFKGLTLVSQGLGTGEITPDNSLVSPFYVCDFPNNQFITKLSGTFDAMDAGWSCHILFKSPNRISGRNVSLTGNLFVTGLLTGKEYIQLNGNEIVKFTKIDGNLLGGDFTGSKWLVEHSASKHAVTDYKAMQLWNKSTDPINYDDEYIALTTEGNFQDLDAVNNSTFVRMPSIKGTGNGGTHMWIRVVGTNPVTLINNITSTDPSHKKFVTITGGNVTVPVGTLIHFIELEDCWFVVETYTTGYTNMELNNKLGDFVYTEENVIANGDSVTESLDKLDKESAKKVNAKAHAGISHEYFGNSLAVMTSGWAVVSSRAMIDKDQQERVYVCAEIVNNIGLNISITAIESTGSTFSYVFCTLDTSLRPSTPYGKSIWIFECFVKETGDRVLVGVTKTGLMYIALGTIDGGHTLCMDFSYIAAH